MKNNTSHTSRGHFSSIEPLEARIAPATIVVNTIADSSDAPNNPQHIVSLRDALMIADTDLMNHPGVVNTITFHIPAAQMNGTGAWDIQLSNLGTLKSHGDVTITGPGAGKLIIDGINKYQVFNFNDTVTTHDSPVTISGLTVERGNASGNGGGIYSTESLTLKNVVISNNTANATAGVAVEGNATAGTHVSISNSLITGNTGIGGGGVGLYYLKSFAISNTVVTGNTTNAFSGGIFAQINKTGTGGSITNCQISGNTAAGGGGADVSDLNTATTSKITITGTKITGNTSNGTGATQGGGGLYVDQGNTVITGSTISDNTAVYNGGGIEANGFTSLTISKCTISGNQTNAAGQGGGGVFIYGSGNATPQPVSITGSLITDNRSASHGGGLLAENGLALKVSNSTFSGNSAVDQGGGLATLETGLGGPVDLTVTGGTFSGNTASSSFDGSGGGIFASGDGKVSISASKLTGNFARNIGGGIYAYSTDMVTVTNVTASGNTGGYGGGLFIHNTSNFQVSGGSFTGNGAAYGGGIATYGSAGTISGVTISGNAATSEGGGVFQKAAGTVHLQIAKVTGNTAPGANGPNYYGTNIATVGLPAHAPAAGHGKYLVTNPTDTAVVGELDLRQALAMADAAQTTHPGVVNTIAFALPSNDFVNGAWTIQLTSGLTSLGNLNIVGPGAGKLIIDGGGKYHILTLDDGSGSIDSPVTISGLSLIDGNASGNTPATGEGGAINSSESLTLKNCTLSGNKAAFVGGAVSVQAYGSATTTVNILNCVISGNSAVNAGGGLSLDANKSVVISGCTVTGNSAKYSGGIYAGIKSTGTGSTLSTGITISKVLISGNTAVKYGGGLYIHDYNLAVTAKGVPLSKVTISSSTISGNSVTGSAAHDTGGGIYCEAGNFVFSKNIISNNTAVVAGGGIEASKATSMSIIGGSIDGNNVTNGTGGGIDLNTGSTPLTVTGTHITGNHASGNGGGIYLKTSGTVNITGSTLNANSSGVAGGGLASEGAGTLNITGGLFSDNIASTDAGGGIYVFNGTDVKIQSAQITGNISTVGEGGGAYLNASGTINVISSIIADNLAANDGGGVNFGGHAMLTLKSDTFAGNTSGKDGGGMRIGPSLTGTITGTKVTGNIALTDGGGIYDNTLGPVTLGTGEAALIFGNSAPTDPNTYNI